MFAAPLLLEPRLVPRVWGGSRLGPPVSGVPIGEAWVVAEDSRVVSGPLAGQTLAQVAGQFPRELLGTRAQGRRFPLLIKLLDCADWLSVQVHPDDEQARALEGGAALGKTEAWHILHAEPGAQIISGIQAGVGQAALADAILAGHLLDHVQYASAHAADTFLMPAGTVHALGPGLLLYEVQQTSDLTYRIYDWNRPAAAGRPLHLAQAAAVSRPVQAIRTATPGGTGTLTRCAYFTLERLDISPRPIVADTGGQSFHVLTLIRGQARVEAGGQVTPLREYDSAVIPAALGEYRLEGQGAALRAALPHA